jgi:nicotinate phosphoribosyltransferase
VSAPPPSVRWLTSPLLTDLYQFTMLQAYFERRMFRPAVFELFVRRLPSARKFLLAAGLPQAVDYLRGLRFSAEDLEQLRDTQLFGDEFLAWLGELRFTGDVDAVREGSVFFADEPILRVTAPLPEAQLVESRLVNLIHFQTSIASKAARCVIAAEGKKLVDFGMRRAHGSEAALLAARASYLAGFDGTATTIASHAFGVPIYGTMAHSFVQAHDTELQAFEHFVDCQRGALVLLIDTYDTVNGAKRVVELARRRPEVRIGAVRLDSGDLAALSRDVRAVLDAGGLHATSIFASGGLDELKIRDLLSRQAPIDAFGVGTSLDVAEDCPALDCVYKLEAYADRPRRKRSSGKSTWPGAKQVFRERDPAGTIRRDVLALDGETPPGEALLAPVLRRGEPVGELPTLAVAREHAARELASLPDGLRSLTGSAESVVEVSASLRELAARVDEEFS